MLIVRHLPDDQRRSRFRNQPEKSTRQRDTAPTRHEPSITAQAFDRRRKLTRSKTRQIADSLDIEFAFRVADRQATTRSAAFSR